MITTNNRISTISQRILKNLIGKDFEYISHEPYNFSSTSYGVTYLSIGESLYSFTDYYNFVMQIGSYDELSHIDLTQVSKIESPIKDVEFIKEYLNLTINKIELINTKQIAYDTINNKTYEFLDTYGIIFTFSDNNYQLALKKDDFGENISIYRGYNLKDKFSYLVKYLTEDYDESLLMSASIEFESI